VSRTGRGGVERTIDRKGRQGGNEWMDGWMDGGVVSRLSAALRLRLTDLLTD
jgi:hypothetical protein